MRIFTVRNDSQLQAAAARIEELWDAQPGTEAFDELDGLATLIAAFERTREPAIRIDPVEAILFRLEQMGKTRKDLESIIGTRARVSEILTRKRSLSIDMIRALHERLGIPLSSLVGKGAPKRPAPTSKRRTAAPVPSPRRIESTKVAAKHVVAPDARTKKQAGAKKTSVIDRRLLLHSDNELIDLEAGMLVRYTKEPATVPMKRGAASKSAEKTGAKEAAAKGTKRSTARS